MMGSRVVRTVMLALVLWPALAFAADTRMMPSCDGKYGLCRYIDRETKQEVIPARFERAFRFSEGLAVVSIEGRFGYIDARGEVAIPPQFELAGEFYQGLAEVLVGDKVGVIDRNGRFVVQPQFKRAVPITKEVVLATEGTWAPHASKTYQRLDWSLLLLDGTFGLYHVNGHWIRRPDLQRVFIFERERGAVSFGRASANAATSACSTSMAIGWSSRSSMPCTT